MGGYMDGISKIGDLLNGMFPQTNDRKKNLSDLKIGDSVISYGDSGFCDTSTVKITDITHKFNESTGEKYPVIHCGDLQYHGIHGYALIPPMAYKIKPIDNGR